MLEQGSPTHLFHSDLRRTKRLGLCIGSTGVLSLLLASSSALRAAFALPAISNGMLVDLLKAPGGVDVA
mgnify:CR=1 FL=1